MPKSTPNILFLFDDQHHAHCCGFAGHHLVQTPNLDALAQKGSSFSNMFASSAICGPSRTSFFLGNYLRNHGHFYNIGDLIPTFPSILTQLKQAGYTTVQCGKNHLPPKIAKDFDEMWSMTTYKDDLASRGIEIPEENKDWHQYFMSSQWKLPEKEHRGVWTAQRAIDFIESDKSKKNPFFMWCSFAPPHAAHRPPESLDNLYKPEDIPIDWEAYYKFESSRMQNRPMIEDFWKVGSVKHDIKIFQKAVCRYLALITLVDREIGRILNSLEQQGLADNTIVIFTADHGDFAGNYGQLGKNLPGYDDLIRIPFIYYDPARNDGGRVVDGMFQNVDLFPTLMERLGLDTPPSVNGISFIPGLDGRPGASRDCVFSETSMNKTVRTADWKLTFCVRHPEKGQLFRMGAEPDEVNNLWDNPEYNHIKMQLMTRLITWMVECEQPDGMDNCWEEYISTRWYNWLSKQPRQAAIQETELPNEQRINK